MVRRQAFGRRGQSVVPGYYPEISLERLGSPQGT